MCNAILTPEFRKQVVAGDVINSILVPQITRLEFNVTIGSQGFGQTKQLQGLILCGHREADVIDPRVEPTTSSSLECVSGMPQKQLILKGKSPLTCLENPNHLAIN
jgi:hypothetical protein